MKACTSCNMHIYHGKRTKEGNLLIHHWMILLLLENPEARPTMLEVYSMLKTDIEPVPTPRKMVLRAWKYGKYIYTAARKLFS
ncbi:hypothetical protein Pyn_31301 [Prunus yedoensis var. nudiflora]|uniref:Uncharacterized protein n=1 Tax=Prunus yedoensis var. nudiflora TaxID=2094558 RepID=A0A314U7H3_PRUYE|nr:hypothetical protein Pyn_31301 [Prunus yedoensis var. nudiflora]